mgnify:CR=1 FL=1|tara:strand:- start:1698 stop:1877 length:180 start_codon:yes stop_codon:yes gene_type:complete
MEIFDVIFGLMWLFSIVGAFFGGTFFGAVAAAKRQQAVIGTAIEGVKSVIGKVKGNGKQ